MTTFRLKDYIGETIDLRESIIRLFDSVILNSSIDTLVFDFSGVTFISRAAADQLLKEQTRCLTKGVKLIFRNVDNDVNEMLQHVTRASSSSIKAPSLPIRQIKRKEDLVSFLSRLLRRIGDGVWENNTITLFKTK